jgi:hypothetical protein
MNVTIERIRAGAVGFPVGCFVIGCLIIAEAAACSSADDRPALSPSMSSPDSSRRPDSASKTTAPDSSAPLPADLCNDIEVSGPQVFEIERLGEAPPALGGTITPGTYQLAELFAYAGPQFADAGVEDGGRDESPSERVTHRVAQATLIATGSTLRIIEAVGDENSPSTPSMRGVTYRVEGTNLIATEACPTAGTPQTIPFTALDGGTLSLLVDPTHRWVYALEP